MGVCEKMARKGFISLMIMMLVIQGGLTGWTGLESAYAADDLTTNGINATTPTLNATQADGTVPLMIEFIKPVKK